MIIQGDSLDVLKTLEADSVDSLVTDPPAGISFMGKAWDGDKGGRDGWVTWLTEVMTECLRVLKPGAHGLVWAIPRTSHWTATALENAGFEVRDVVTHLFGTGFPKSLDISKAIDKAAGAEREVIGTKLGMPGYSLASEVTNDGWRATGLKNPKGECEITAPATDAALKWQGFGTALKPASEHWILVRKPLASKTVAANVLEYGTGGINIDGCRIEAADQAALAKNWDRMQSTQQSEIATALSPKEQIHLAGYNKASLGRFPANLLLSHNPGCGDECEVGCAVGELDGQSGTLKTHGGAVRADHAAIGYSGGRGSAREVLASSGGASRFFYCAKASKKDRGEGNDHPTVKSSELMAYLVRLVTPPQGIVLDPFMGSGSTGVAAKREGMDFIGIEQDPAYVVIAEKRLGA